MPFQCKFTKEQLYVPTLLIIYVLSGSIQPIVLEFIKHEGGAEPLAMLFPIPNSIAMGLVLFAPQPEGRINFIKKFWKISILMTCIDVIATTMTLFGQILCGSGIYIIIYSSLTIWSALGSKFSMKKVFNVWQIIGVCVVTAGLMISGISALTDKDNNTDIIIGVFITLVGTVLHSCVYWLNEYFNFKTGMNMQLICGYSGIMGVGLYFIYLCCYTIPFYQQTLIDPVEQHGGHWWPDIILLYSALIFVDLLHVFCQYTVVPRAGSVTMGIAKAISSMIVFVLSHFIFCSDQYRNQCIDVFKGASLAVVLTGVIIYSAATKKKVIKNADDNAGLYKELNHEDTTDVTESNLYSTTKERSNETESLIHNAADASQGDLKPEKSKSE